MDDSREEDEEEVGVNAEEDEAGASSSLPPPDPCYRCCARVYPVERVDVGVLFHKKCFRCRVCCRQLTLRTFHWDNENEPDVYCNVHVPKLVATIDHEAMGIKAALNAPRKGTNVNEQIRGSVYNPGWEYDANALEFAHHRDIMEQGNRRPFATYEDFETSGIFDAQNDLEKRQKEEEDKLYMQLKEEREIKIKRLEEDLEVEKECSVVEVVTGFERLVSQQEKINLAEETKKLEEEYRQKKQERLKVLLEKLNNEERNQVAQLIEKHSQEMLVMIAEKLNALQEKKSESEGTEEELMDLSKPPYVGPPEFKKTDIYDTPRVFEQLDNSVFEIAKKDYSTFTGLVRDLTRNCENELEKARVIFRWVTWMDLNKLEVDETVHPDSPLGLLRGIKYGTESYHDLFKRLCSYAGMFCEIIQGYSKGAGYRPGMRLQDEHFRNSWTAVCIEGSWQFVNCNWGARHVKPGLPKRKTDDLQEFFYMCDEFYFITEPEKHIYQHLPDDPAWQLLESPISMSEFIKLPVVKSPFFNYRIHFADHYQSIQQTEKGRVVIELKIPSLLGFGYTLDIKDRKTEPPSVEGRVMLRIVGHKAIFVVAPPRMGKYYFTIYAKDRWDSELLQSACVFQIKCSDRENLQRNSFPPISFFGPTPSLSNFGLLPIGHLDPFIQYEGEDLQLQFELHQAVKLSHSLQFYGSMENTSCVDDFHRFVFIKYRDDMSILYQIRCPIRGFYVFSVFGAGFDRTGDEPYDCAFRYLINCRQSGKDKRPLPRACHRWFNCTLLAPQVGDLHPDKKVSFKVCVPGAADIAMLIEDTWFHFKETSPGIWEGTVVAGRRSSGAKIYAKLNKDRSRFSPLVEFKVK